MKQVILLEMNEIALPYVERYVSGGLLPNFQRMLDKFGYVRTESESEYEHLEPWIQWVTVHSGLSYGEHRLFRLGDVAGADVRQIYEILEEKGLRVGAISPMNAVNRLREAAFFVPDPWTGGAVSGPANLKKLYDAIAQAVNDNAQSRITPGSLLSLLIGFLRYFRLPNLLHYLRYGLSSRSRPWTKALFLDCFLADVFMKLWERTRPDFSSLFLNGAAHVQHHYFFNSSAYSGGQHNPSWYVRPGVDPILEVYQLYDRILGAVIRMAPDARVIMATGLSQDPYERPVFYYRLRQHEAFLRKIGIEFVRVLPRMSRDFLIECRDSTQARAAEKVLRSGTLDGAPLFDVDNRGSSLFVTLSYPHQVETRAAAMFSTAKVQDFGLDVAFVAMKNGEHNGIGYFIDTGSKKSGRESIPLASVFHRLVDAFSG